MNIVCVGIVLATAVCLARATMNLFIAPDEVKKLLGLSSELYYIREGVVNNYAMQFNVVVREHIDELNFVWQSLRHQPITYSIAFIMTPNDALGTPRLNISRRGEVSRRPSVFHIYFPCTGQASAEVEVVIQMNFTIVAVHNVTVLNFKRPKICIKDDKQGVGAVGGHSVEEEEGTVTHTNNGSITIADQTSIFSSADTLNLAYIVVGCACGLIVVVSGITLTVYIRSRKARWSRGGSQTSGSNRLSSYVEYSSQSHLRAPPLDGRSRAGSLTSKADSYVLIHRVAPTQTQTLTLPMHHHPVMHSDGASVHSAGTLYANGSMIQLTDSSTMLTDRAPQIRVARSQITLKDVLMEGTFCRIYLGILHEPDTRSSREVFVKTVLDNASSHQVSLLVAEGMQMLSVIHPNVQPLVGLCLEDRVHPLLLYPYAYHGNLKKFLHKCKFSAEGHAHVLVTHELVDMALQIAQGLQHLHRLRIVHKDLASRNIVIDDRLRVRITDNALSRDLFPADYHCLGDNENRPIKWLALESLSSKMFTPASDVWSFGVTLWELMTLAKLPYAEIDPFEMAAYLRDGYRLSQPINCPDELFALMAYCWSVLPEDRPVSGQLIMYLQEFYAALTRYV